MNEELLNNKENIIKERFNDNRTIRYVISQEEIENDETLKDNGDIFITDNGEIINLKYQISEFDAEELSNNVEFAEKLYEKYGKPVSVYLLCPEDINITVKECDIKSFADFKIRLATAPFDSNKLMLSFIKAKIENNEALSPDYITILEMLPLICKKEERHYYLTEYLKIISKLPC